MTVASDIAALRAVMVQAGTNDVAALDIAAKAPSAANLTAVVNKITADWAAVITQLNKIKTSLPVTPPPTRSVKATVHPTIAGRVDLQEVNFTASARRRDGGAPNVGDQGWSGPIVGGDAPGRDLTGLQRNVAEVYVVGMQDSVKGDWVSTSVTIPAAVVTPPPPPLNRSVTATINTAIPGRVDLQEVNFTASDRRRDGGTPNAGDQGWSGSIVEGDAPGRDLTSLQAGTTYVVGMKDTAKGDWVSASVKMPGAVVTPPPPPPPTGAGGLAAVRARLGQQTQHRAWVDGQTARWKQLSGGWAPVWYTNTQVETDLATAVAEFSDPAAPRTVFRISGTNDSFNNGSRDGDLDNYGRQLQQLTQAQGKPQMIRPDYEWDGNWMQWRGEGQVPQFTAAIERIYNRVKANCPTIELDLCCSLGWGGGDQGINSHRHDLWDAVMAVLGGTYKGGIVKYFDTDAYSNGPPGGTWLKDEQALLLDRALTWGTELAHGEWGIGDSQLSQAPHNWTVEQWVNAWIDWWITLPAKGAGALGHVDIFDLGPWPGPNDFPDGRTFSFAPSNNEGQRAVQAMKARLA